MEAKSTEAGSQLDRPCEISVRFFADARLTSAAAKIQRDGPQQIRC
jgi:hypothetical protein